MINNVQILETGNITRPSRTGPVREIDDGYSKTSSVVGEGRDYSEGTGLLSEPTGGGVNSQITADSLQDTQNGRSESAAGRPGIKASRTAATTEPATEVQAQAVRGELVMKTFDQRLLPPEMLKAMTGSDEDYEDWLMSTSDEEISDSIGTLMSQIDPLPPTSDSPERSPD